MCDAKLLAMKPALFKATSVLLALGLLGCWIYLSRDFAFLALDYPLRRAGESDEYPALGTGAFYIGCASALLSTSVTMLIVFSVPLALVILMLVKSFGLKSRFLLYLATTMVLLVPVAAHGVALIRNHIRIVAELKTRGR